MPLHTGQQTVLDSNARFKVIRAGRRWGKTQLASYWLTLLPGGAIQGYPVAFFSPKYKLLLDVWADAVRYLKLVIAKHNRTDMRITLKTGGIIDFWTLEDINAGRGRKYKKIVIDEAAHAPHLKEIWERAISPTLTDYKGEAWFISTPNGMNFFSELYNKIGNDWQSFHMPTNINPYIPAEEIESRRLEMPELVFKQEYLAEFVTFGAGLVKPEHIRYADPPYGSKLTMGVDLAISEKQSADWTAIAIVALDLTSGIVYIKEIERFRAGFAAAKDRIIAAYMRHKPSVVAIESTQYQSAMVQEIARTTQIPVYGIKPDRDKVTRFAPLITRYEQGLVRHSQSGVPSWFLDEVTSFPENEHDDGVDAVGYAYAAHSKFPTQQIIGNIPRL
jgi:predicted phage terminase large subunit-like protein